MLRVGRRYSSGFSVWVEPRSVCVGVMYMRGDTGIITFDLVEERRKTNEPSVQSTKYVKPKIKSS